ncbi:MAG: DUF547 domain-containing protein [Proteobacteria bacterium]|nr:DUF547 domain-containing protein [Pseudomonadota bacterium]
MRALFAVFSFLLTLASAAPSDAAPKANLWPVWSAHNAASTEVVDHGAWAKFLKSFQVVGEDGLNRIAYGKVTKEGKAGLDGYLRALTSTDVKNLNRNEQLAYWINLYNALTVKVILDHYPVETILDIKISPGFFSPGPWGKKLLTIQGEKVSLDDIEHRILRPIWKDARIHYAVNCASVGCPNLQPSPFTGARADAMLTEAAQDFINGSRAVWFDGNSVGASSIYKWFSQDFGRNDKEILAHIRKYAAPSLAGRLANKSDINFYSYDWDLNEIR